VVLILTDDARSDMGKAVAMATDAMNLTIDDVTILHYDPNLPCGQVRFRTGALEYGSPCLPFHPFVTPDHALAGLWIGH
jgi:peptidyl-tRNA hydrolase